MPALGANHVTTK